MSTPYRITAQFWDHATLWSDNEEDAGHSTDGGRVFGITRTRYVECDHYGCKPVAVIDPEDREQIERLIRGFWANGNDDCNDVLAMQAALREFVDPKPPHCTAALILKGEQIPCEGDEGHALPHSNAFVEAVWGAQS